jgi:hypothetical protein
MWNKKHIKWSHDNFSKDVHNTYVQILNEGYEQLYVRKMSIFEKSEPFRGSMQESNPNEYSLKSKYSCAHVGMYALSLSYVHEADKPDEYSEYIQETHTKSEHSDKHLHQSTRIPYGICTCVYTHGCLVSMWFKIAKKRLCWIHESHYLLCSTRHKLGLVRCWALQAAYQCYHVIGWRRDFGAIKLLICIKVHVWAACVKADMIYTYIYMHIDDGSCYCSVCALMIKFWMLACQVSDLLTFLDKFKWSKYWGS